MAAEYMCIGIPVLNKKEGMTYNAGTKFQVSSAGDYDLRIGYLKLGKGTPLPEVLPKQPHVAYRVDNLELYTEQAQQVVLGPMDCGPGVRLTFVIWDDAIVELYEEKQEGET